MMVEQQISKKIQEALSPQFLDLQNESYMHNVPKDSESHFKAVIVSDAFDGMLKVKRHQTVYAILAEEMNIIHALALHTFTQQEWDAKQDKALLSPKCLGGSKHESEVS